MSDKKTKTSFTKSEYEEILALVAEKEMADSTRQKSIRDKIRKIGLYWSEVAPHMVYSVENVKALFANGTLTLKDGTVPQVDSPKNPVRTKDMTCRVDELPESLREVTIPKEDEITQYQAAGFEGFVTVGRLKENINVLPDGKGVYIVIRDSEEAPEFLEVGTGGFFKGKDPNVSISTLEENYVADSKTVYIGKATSLRKRVDQLIKFGNGKNIGHFGGRYLWQLADSSDLIVAWKLTPDCDPKIVESQMIGQFRNVFGKRPFANLKD